ncbi:Kinesin-like protein KIN-10A [Bienertia sinuspersici]
MAPTPSSSSKTTNHHNNYTQIRTPISKQRLHFNSSKISHPSPNPNQNPNHPPAEHPVEVIGRIRNLPESVKDEKPLSNLLQVNPNHQTIRVKTEIGYRDFTLDGVSSSEDDDLDGFYKKFIEARILGVKMGAKCTVMMYGPTGSGKSHTMFGCLKQPGIVYKSLKDILGDKELDNGEENDEEKKNFNGVGMFVQVTVLEIYNEEIYDLLSCEKGVGSFNLWSKGSGSKVKLEVMGKKAKNATYISGNEAGKILKEIQKVEKRRIVRSTNCNDRSSRSHCMIILDVPTVGGRLMLVDMAGSENIEQAGQAGFEAKMQTAKINQGNTALKRVVESIANGDSHVPFRDSKLTMLLQDSFEDDKSKILMILCASPDPRETHKTISTLEYGAKAKCIVRGPHTPVKDKILGEDSASAVILGSRITAMDQFILKLQMENKQKDKECSEAKKLLQQKEVEVSQLRAKLEHMGKGSEEEINEKVDEMIRRELEKRLEECQRMANEYVELEKKRMEEKVQRQQQEVEMLRRRLEEMEVELSRSRDGSSDGSSGAELDGIGLVKRLKEVYADDDPGMEKSMDLDMGDQESYAREVIIGQYPSNMIQGSFTPILGEKSHLSTVFEEEEVEAEDEDENARSEDDEVEKKVIEEKKVSTTPQSNNIQLTPSSRNTRIQNIFTLCGNYRELSQRTPESSETLSTVEHSSPMTPPVAHSQPSLAVTPEPQKENLNPSPSPKSATPNLQKENFNPLPNNENEVLIEVYAKWEATKENPGKFIDKLKVVQDATLADLRKLIEIHLGVDKQDFTFLSLGDPTGAPILREKEETVLASKLPACNNQLGGHLACLRLAKGGQCPNVRPFTSLENKLPATPVSCAKKMVNDSVSPSLDLGSTPYITLRRY